MKRYVSTRNNITGRYNDAKSRMKSRLCVSVAHQVFPGETGNPNHALVTSTYTILVRCMALECGTHSPASILLLVMSKAVCLCVFSLPAVKSKSRISLVKSLGTKCLTVFGLDSNAFAIPNGCVTPGKSCNRS